MESWKSGNQEIKSKLAKCSVENQKNQEIKSKLEIKSGNKIQTWKIRKSGNQEMK